MDIPRFEEALFKTNTETTENSEGHGEKEKSNGMSKNRSKKQDLGPMASLRILSFLPPYLLRIE